MTVTQPSTLSWSLGNRIGFTLAALVGALNIASIAQPTPDGEVGAPFGVLVADAVIGAATLGLVAYAWLRRSRFAARLVAALLVLMVVSALPAFFVDVPGSVKAMVSVAVLLTVVTCALVLSPGPAREPIS